MSRTEADVYRLWSECDECGFQGLLDFLCRGDEDYADTDALGYMMDSSCPACGQETPVLVVVEEFEEMVRLSKQSRLP